LFLDPSAFDFVAGLEAAWTDVRDECIALPRDGFEPWVQREMYGEGWSVYGLVAFGTRIDAALASCPRTAALLSGVPGLTTAGFSRMAPGTHIVPHVGWVRTVYRLHMGLVVPPDCALRVGDEVRSWREGGCLVFDDTIEHEAWNRSREDRFVLLLDFLRPGVRSAAGDVPPPEVQAMIARVTGSGS
jgi:aspartyl/asparaginyl beta-hydroxylase (cupin superfamily)